MERTNEANADLKGWLDRKLSETVATFDRKLSETVAAFDRKLADRDAALDQKLTEMGAVFEQKLTELDTAFDRRLAERDVALDHKLAERDAALDRKLTGLRDDIVTRTGGMLEARTAEILEVIHGSEARTRAHFDVLSEGLQTRIKLVAEGYTALAERQDRTEARLVSRIDVAERDLGTAIRTSHARLGYRNRKRSRS